MHRLFMQTLGVGGRERDGDEILDLFGILDDAFSVNLSVDVREVDQLVCPTCMRVHFTVKGSERIAIPKEKLEVESVREEGEKLWGSGEWRCQQWG